MDGWGRADPAGVWLEAAGSGNRGSVAVGGSLGRPIGLATSSSPPPSSWRRRLDPARGWCKVAGSGRASGWIRWRWSAEAGGGACGGSPGRLDGLGCYPLPTPPHSSPLPTVMVARWPHLAVMRWRQRQCGGQRRVRAAWEVEWPCLLSPPPSPPSSLLAEFLLHMPAWWPDLPTVVASAHTRWLRQRCGGRPHGWRRRWSSGVTDVFVYDGDGAACANGGSERACAVEHRWRPERPGGLSSFPSTRSSSPCSTSAALNHSANRSNGLGDSLAGL
jgi:hypothetical protein